jgi:hypothetical protein
MRPPALLVALACAVGLAVAGCGGSGDEAAVSASPATAAATDTADSATTGAASDLRGVAIAVRRDPG